MAKVKTRFKSGHPRHFIKEWRKHRGLTLERLAERLEVTAGNLSQLERGDIGYTQPMLEALADALQCSTGDLVSCPPGANNVLSLAASNLMATVKDATPEQIAQINELAKVIMRTGTEG